MASSGLLIDRLTRGLNGSVLSLAEPNNTANKLCSAQEDIPQAEQLAYLRQETARLNHILQVMPAGVVVIDGNGGVRQANQLAKSLLGEPLEGELWRTIIQRSFKPQADDGHEVSLFDGRKVKLSITPLINEPGQLIVLTDLTETRQLQQRIGHLQKLSSLGKMVASLAHQIRTPLSAAMLYAANLSNNTLSKDARNQFADKLLSRLRDLESQVNDMLLFAKSGSEQVVGQLSLQSLLQEVQLGAEVMLTKQQAVLTVNLPEPDILVLGNKAALAGALQNLIHNALVFTPMGAQITLTACRDESQAKWVNISVSDNGPGIKKEHLKQIFEPFFTTRSHGTGLGLAVVKTVAQSHHGKVSVSNIVGGGACFTLRLPVLSELSQLAQSNVQFHNKKSQPEFATVARN
ncbi:sensor histidine kinase [Paraglaciecola hydrolytica]|uniref:histidine kinase n=1 Tax=Paraglaciecola hydrolytica TaxID=1799789 RepID=A0A148KNM1_9ALTE|nr:ATP-binding protein [Paraglaciecola hydrolytica]KXI27926.1 PAS domain-containing sensor histidine kinase [Paraglaciecola hydrolytica]